MALERAASLSDFPATVARASSLRVVEGRAAAMLKRLFRRAQGPSSRTFQQDLDLYLATTLLTVRNRHRPILESGSAEDCEKVVGLVSEQMQSQGRGLWARMMREELNEQMKPLLEHVERLGGQDPYPRPKRKPQGGGEGGSLLEQRLDYRGRDLDIEDCPVKHWEDDFEIQIKRSGIKHREAGLGVMVRGNVLAGSVLCIYPGRVWWPGKYGGPRENAYAISRYDGIVIDALKWDEEARDTALKHQALQEGIGSTPLNLENSAQFNLFRNPFAIGSFVNHPPPGKKSNVMHVAFDFPASNSFVPHRYARTSRPLYMFDYLANSSPSVVLIATRNLCDEELLLNYRLNPALEYPEWYVQPDPEEAARRWAPHSFWT